VLNSIVYSVSLRLTPTSDPMATAMMPPAFHSPVLFTIFLFGALAITVLTLYWVGQGLGGKARLTDVLVLICWLQVLRLILQLAVAILVIVAPVLGAMVILIATLWGIYILVGFVAARTCFRRCRWNLPWKHSNLWRFRLRGLSARAWVSPTLRMNDNRA